MRGAYLCSNMFYSFWFRPSSRQHLAFEMYLCSVLLVCLFIVFACELVWNVKVNQKGFLHIKVGLYFFKKEQNVTYVDTLKLIYHIICLEKAFSDEGENFKIL